VLALSLAAAGWRQTAVGAAALVFVGGVLLASRMRTRPEDYGLLPDGETRPDGPQDSTAVPRRPAAAMARDFTAAEALRTRAFWLLSIAHSFSIVALTAATVHQIPYMVSGLGMSTQAAAAVVALFTGVQLVAQLGCGLVGDRINKRYAIAALTLGQGVALAVLGLLHSLAGPLLFAVLLGACWGARMPLILAIRGDYFGRKSYATIAGWLNATLAAGSMVGPVLAGVLADRLGTYNPVFLILSVLPAVGAGLFFLAKAPVPGTASVQTSALP
ncbi:MAG: MFS transporter, partial [Chloroflexi bacterium]|nr:MFS transporter [Chloroflexota bacterium]